MLRTEGRVKMQKNTYNTTQVVKPIKEVTISSGRRVLTSNNCNVPVYRGQGHCSGKLVGKIINKPTNIPIRRPRSKPKRPKRKEVKFTRLEHEHCTVSRVSFKTGKLKWGASSRWPSSLYCSMRNSDQMTFGKTHPTL